MADLTLLIREIKGTPLILAVLRILLAHRRNLSIIVQKTYEGKFPCEALAGKRMDAQCRLKRPILLDTNNWYSDPG